MALTDGTALPFLLAARAQGEMAASSGQARAFFAEGLCSSYEAFHHTRDNRGDVRDVDDEGNEQTAPTLAINSDDPLVPIIWYEDQISALIPSRETSPENLVQHPKLRAVIDRVVYLWSRGEKVLVFCFYRETAKALRDHLKAEVAARIERLIGDKLGITDKAEIVRAIERIVRSLSESTGPYHKALEAYLEEILKDARFKILLPWNDQLRQMLVAYFRSPAFLARHVPVELVFADGGVKHGAGSGPELLIEEIRNAPDARAQEHIRQFLDFAKELAERSQNTHAGTGFVGGADDERETQLDQYLAAVAVYSELQQDDRAHDDDEDARKPGSYRVLPVVRMVFGDTKPDVRERLMQAFNSPLFPEILVSSSVLGEGVDLHRFCRYIVHHDLCWNPSTLEQRTGRLDRIGCKAEYSHQPIVIYEPYIGGSADEKMFRVVQDRERWFQVVMGQKFEFNEANSEKIADRVPLPEALARRLIFNLHV